MGRTIQEVGSFSREKTESVQEGAESFAEHKRACKHAPIKHIARRSVGHDGYEVLRGRLAYRIERTSRA